MDNNKLQEEMVTDESCRLCNILNFQDFVQEGKKEVKKTKLKVKSREEYTREEYTNDMEDDSIDPNDNPDHFIKLREQFIKDELQ